MNQPLQPHQSLLARKALLRVPADNPAARPIENLHVITSYFNPCGYRRLRDNYWRFRANLNAPLHTIELLFDGQAPEISDAHHVGSNTVLWHKEALLNILIDRLPRDVDAVAWVDADILFQNPYWVEHTCQALAQHAVVQPWSASTHVMPDGSHEKYKPSAASMFVARSKYWKNFSIATPGFAWAARTDWLRKHKLSDTHIIGGGDTLMIAAFTDTPLYIDSRLSPAHREWHMQWVRAVQGEVRRSLGYVPGEIHHLWHGFKNKPEAGSTRNYIDRYDKLAQFDPSRDLVRQPNGLWSWSLAADPVMVQSVAEHFPNRNDDVEYVSGSGY